MELPKIGYGTYLMDSAASELGVKNALEAGYRHIDTAQGYENEAGVGAGMKASGVDRGEVFVTTKLWPGGKWGQRALTYEEVVEAGEKSLKELDCGYLDLYLIHTPFAFASGKEAGLDQWRGCLALKKRGIARQVGVSNFNQAHLSAIYEARMEMPLYNQLEIHPCCQQRQLLAFMEERGVKAIAYSSLAPLGSWREGQDSGKDRMGKERTEIVGSTLKKIAGEMDATEPQVLLRWALEKGYPILPKSTNVGRMKLNLRVGEMGELGKENMELLDALGGGGEGTGVEDVCLAWAFGDPAAAS
ncbi:hypothetical protein TrRE_jg8017 [Triparma retinervis]|uniref:NADP-dependent oxidoreductase domain-containing protein n=1 Tax=Triparma retinervis TaxID=2557542 RepID=A0A9W6ZLI1_9STRA|nr:hypothetical protein TrRE_jg8017 [Triparma retinervis]